MLRTNSMLVVVALSVLTPALAQGAIITATLDLSASAISGQTLDGLAAQAVFILDTASPSALVIQLKNTSTGAPVGTLAAGQILSALSFDLGAAGSNAADPKITGGSVVIGLGGVSVNFSNSPVLGAGADVSPEWGYGNEGATSMFTNLFSAMSAHTTKMAAGNLDNTDGLDGPQGGLVTNPAVVDLGGQGAIADSVVATLTLDKPLTDLSFLVNGVRAEFGSDYRFSYDETFRVPEPGTITVLVLGGVAALIRRRR